MSCSLTYPSCPAPTTWFPSGVPTIQILSECCSETGEYTDFEIVGTNDISPIQKLYIDGSFNQCAPLAQAISPCIDDDLGGTLVVQSYTTGLISPGNNFQVTVRYYWPECGECVNHSTVLNIFMISDSPTGDPNLCCMVSVPITVVVTDQAPFTLSTGAITCNAIVGVCDTDTFTITNDSCLQRRYSIALTGCSPDMTISDTDITLNPGQTSSGITVTYCPTTLESGSCQVTITSIAVATEDPCDSVQLIDVQYRSVQSQPMCSDCNVVYIDGTLQEDTCDNICANVGQEICVTRNIQFPIRQFLITGADNINNSFSVLGQWAGFPDGSTFSVSGSTCNDGSYVIASTSYDSVTNTTTIFTVGAVPCATVDGSITVDTSQDLCTAFATLVITNTVTGAEIVNVTYNPVGGFIYLNYCFTIADFGDYQISLTWGDCFDTINCTINVSACQQYVITKTGCHLYVITDSHSAAGKIDTVLISNFSGTYTAEYEIDLSQGNTLNITLPGDDVYTVTITDNLTSNTFTDIIYDFCDLIACYRKMILDIFCNEKDPCCKECNQQELNDIQFKRDELNKLNALAGSLFAYIHRDKITHMGIFTIDECRVTDIQMIMDISDKIRQILERCGECGKTITTSSPTPCTTCG